MQRRRAGLIGSALLLVAPLLTGCGPTGGFAEPAPTPTSTESVSQALARVQVPADTPVHVPAGDLDPSTLRRLAVVAPATWYVGRSKDGGYCALGVWTTGGSSVSSVRCVGEGEFTSAGIKSSIGEARRQSRVWIAPDAGAVHQAGWSVVGPSLLIPAAGPLSTPTR